MRPWLLPGLVVFALLGTGCGTSTTEEAASAAAVVPEGLAGTWRFADVVSPLPEGVPVPPPVQQALNRTKSRLGGLVMTLTMEVARVEGPGRATVEGPLTFTPGAAGAAGAGTLNLPAHVLAVLGSDRTPRPVSVTWTATTLHLPRPEGTVVFHRQP